MSTSELVERIQRIYAAAAATVEGDLAKFPPRIISDERSLRVYQDFLGGLSDPEVSNFAHSVVHNIANLRDHLRAWARKNGHDPAGVDKAIDSSFKLRVIKDLSNNDKHGYPSRMNHSGKKPKLVELARGLRSSTQAKPGSMSGFVLTSSGLKPIGDGSSRVVVTGRIVDETGNFIGDLQEFCLEAIADWEAEARRLGVPI